MGGGGGNMSNPILHWHLRVNPFFSELIPFVIISTIGCNDTQNVNNIN